MREPACRRQAQLPRCGLSDGGKLRPERETVVSYLRRSQHMSRTRNCRFSTKQRLSALVCFVALMLMYAQVASAAVMVITGTCCSGDQCPIHGNHHHSQKTDDPPMDCGHGEHNMNTMDNCSLSCCHDSERPVVHANLFLLTPLSVSTSLASYSAIPFSGAISKISLARAPLAPPPKSFLS